MDQERITAAVKRLMRPTRDLRGEARPFADALAAVRRHPGLQDPQSAISRAYDESDATGRALHACLADATRKSAAPLPGDAAVSDPGATSTEAARPPSRWDPSVPAELDAIVLRALESDPAKRFATARELALAIERCVPAAPTLAVVEWLDQVAHDEIHARDALLEGLERELPAPPPSASRKEDPSSIEVVAQPRPQPRRRQTLLVAAVGIAALAALGVGTLALRGEPTRSAATAPRVPASPAPPPSASVADVAPVASEPRVVQPVTDVVPDDPPAPRAVPPKAGKQPAKAGAVKPADDCTPPYTYDAIGRRIYKRNCLDAR